MPDGAEKMTEGEKMVWAAAFVAYLQACRGTSLNGGFLPRAREQSKEASRAAAEAVELLRHAARSGNGDAMEMCK